MTTKSQAAQLAKNIYSLELSAEETIGLARGSVLPAGYRHRRGHWDWGGEQSDVGLCLRRVGFNIEDDADDQTFGVYLGKHDCGYVVATKSLLSVDLEISGGLVYGSIHDLMAAWELD